MSAFLILALAAADPLAVLRAQDAALARVGYRLASRGAPLCRGDGHPAGVVIERLSQYDRADRAAAGVGPLPTVTIVVPGSPADAAGLRVGDQVAAIDGERFVTEDPARAAVDYAPTGTARERFDTALRDGRATLDIVRADGSRAVVLTAPAGCAAQFQIRPSGKLNSYSDGNIVQITSAVAARAAGDGDLAAVVAHELAHNILRHPQQLKALGRPRGAVRASELAADRLSVYLLELSGYSFVEARDFLAAILRKTSWGILSDGTHPGWRERIAAITAERAHIDAQRARGEPVRPPPDLMPPAP